MTTSLRRWLGAITAATLVVTTLQAQEPAFSGPALRVDFRSSADRVAGERAPSNRLDAKAIRESVRREAANIGQTAPKTPVLQTKKGLSRKARIGIAAAVGFAAGLVIGYSVVEGTEDMHPSFALMSAGIGAGVGTAIGFNWK